jgi:periplasmic divalent cation tolerance protein
MQGVVMTTFVEISWSAASIDEARRVSRLLVQQRLVASAQIIPWIESITLLDNKLETAQETRVLFKTLRDKAREVEEVIQKNSSYEVPEIVVTSIESANESYLLWMEEIFSPVKQ